MTAAAPNADLARDAIIDALHRAFEAKPRMLALHLGGSDASGRTDDASDIDACVTVEDDAVESAFEIAEHALAALSPIRHRFRLPEPTWHGHAQCFYALADADPRHMIDLCVIKRSASDKFLERERHGEPHVLFDRADLLTPIPLDRLAHQKKVDAKRETLLAQFPLFQPLVTKALDRGHLAEAVHFYLALTWRPLVDACRIRHCPERFDFGPRYLDRDVPADVRATLERLACAAGPAELRAHHAKAQRLFHDAIA